MFESSSADIETIPATGLIDQLIFLAHFFGKRADRVQLLADTPIVDDRISEAQIHECASRAGLALTRSESGLREFKDAELPVLLKHTHGDSKGR